MMSAFQELELPGFRFHPTEQELLEFYLLNTVTGKRACFDVIGFLNIYRHDPIQLPKLAMISGEREWYFFVPMDRKLGRPNRTTGNGFWKATGTDRKIIDSLTGLKRVIGLKKTLVFYQGKAPHGKKTDWIMNEYRLPDNSPLSKDVALCKIYRKATPLKAMEQRAALEESLVFKMELEEEEGSKLVEEDAESMAFREKLTELQVPNKYNLDWTQDTFWTQLNSPWLQNLTPDYANIINNLY